MHTSLLELYLSARTLLRARTRSIYAYLILVELVRSIYTYIYIYIILVFVKEGGRRARAKGEPKGGRRGKDARITQAALCRLRNSAM